MRIYRPQELQLLRLGLPMLPANGGGGSSSSDSSQSATTTNIDKRIATDSGVIAQDGSVIQYTALDGGAIKAAFDFATIADATNSAGFSQLLKVAEGLTTKTQDTATTLASRFQDSVMDAWDRAKAAESGGVDQKTMILLAGTAAAALVLMKRKG